MSPRALRSGRAVSQKRRLTALRAPYEALSALYEDVVQGTDH